MSRAEIILLQFDIAGHSRIDIPPRNLQQARKLLQKYISALVAVQRNTSVSWAGDGGWCWFEITEAADFTMATDAAIDILGMVPRINEILLRDRVIQEPLAIRLSADTMNVELDEDPSHFCAPQMNQFLKYERNIGLVSSLVVTKRIFQHLQSDFKKRFNRWRYSPELETDLYVYDGARIRNETLKQMRNRETEENAPRFVQVTAFEGDCYHDLCSSAYDDLALDVELPNIESVRFIAYRNALANSVIDLVTKSDITQLRHRYETQDALFMAIAEAPYEVMHEAHLSFRATMRPSGDQDNKYSEHFDPVARAISWCNENVVFKGGEQVRFFNAPALGFVAEIGESTLLDHAFADSLRIRSVTGGGVTPPAYPPNTENKLDS